MEQSYFLANAMPLNPLGNRVQISFHSLDLAGDR